MAAVTETERAEAQRGFFALVSAFTIWGLLPLYLRALAGVSALQIMACRLVLCCGVVLTWLGARGALGGVLRALRQRSTRVRLIASALLISTNWFVYIWAVGSGRVVEASLGYFINPLLNVVLGVVLLRERLRGLQWTAIALAAAGVSYLTWRSGAPPWIALALALSFGVYGLLRKTVAVDALTGLAAETSLLAPVGIAYLVSCEFDPSASLLRTQPAAVLVLLLFSGVVTAVPLWLFAFGARALPYATVGLIQYVGPSLQLWLGIWVFHEAFPPARALGFAMIWAGLALYSFESLRSRLR